MPAARFAIRWPRPVVVTLANCQRSTTRPRTTTTASSGARSDGPVSHRSYFHDQCGRRCAVDAEAKAMPGANTVSEAPAMATLVGSLPHSKTDPNVRRGDPTPVSTLPLASNPKLFLDYVDRRVILDGFHMAPAILSTVRETATSHSITVRASGRSDHTDRPVQQINVRTLRAPYERADDKQIPVPTRSLKAARNWRLVGNHARPFDRSNGPAVTYSLFNAMSWRPSLLSTMVSSTRVVTAGPMRPRCLGRTTRPLSSLTASRAACSTGPIHTRSDHPSRSM